MKGRIRGPRFAVLALLSSLAAAPAPAAYVIRTMAGRGLGDGRAAIDASLAYPSGVAFTPTGTLLIADRGHHRIRRVGGSGLIETLIGARQGILFDGEAADQVELKEPVRVRPLAGGDLLVTERFSHRVRRYDAATGTVHTIAGVADQPGSAGDGGPATAAHLELPMDAIADAAGNVYVADAGNHRVRRIAPDGTISTFAGTGIAGYAGDGMPAALAELDTPSCLALGPGGGLLVCDSGNDVIRGIASNGVVSTVAGLGRQAGFADGDVATARLDRPTDLVVTDDGGLVIADAGNQRLRRLDAGWAALSTLAGTGTKAFAPDGAQALSSPLADPLGVAIGPGGEVVFAESAAHRVRAIVGGALVTLAGDGIAFFGGDGGPAIDATFQEPKTAVPLANGDLLVADAGNSRIRRIDAGTGVVATVAGDGRAADAGDGGPALAASLARPSDVLALPDGSLVVSDTDNDRIRRVRPDGTIVPFAGTGVPGDGGDGGPAVEAQLDHPTGIALDGAGNVYVADFNRSRIRRVTPGGTITTVAGTGVTGFGGDGGPATAAQLANPTDLDVDAVGNLLIADYGNDRIRRVDAASGVITTIAGDGVRGSGGDGGPAVAARLYEPSDVKRAPDGSLLVADSGNHRIRRIDAGGVIATVAGTGEFGLDGDGGPATDARLSAPLRLTPLPDGRVLVADRDAGVIRVLVPDDGSPTTTTSSSTSTSSTTATSSTTSSTAVTSSSTTTPSSSTPPSTTTSTTLGTPTTTSTTTTLPPTACELLAGKKLVLRTRRGGRRGALSLLSFDPAVTLGGGNGSSDDPVLHGGSLRVVARAGDGFDETYALPADRWLYKQAVGRNRGYRFRRTNPIKSVVVQPGKRVKIVAGGEGLGHTLGAEPDPVDVVLTLGAHCYCLRFGGDVEFRAERRFRATDAPAPVACTAAAADQTVAR